MSPATRAYRVATALIAVVALGLAPGPGESTGETGPHLATGFKVGEVTADSAIVWVRATRG